MENLTDNELMAFYTKLSTEQTRLMGELKNKADDFKKNEQLFNQISSLMKSTLKYRHTREKLSND